MTTESREFCPNCGDPVERRSDGRAALVTDAPLSNGGRLGRDAALCDACYFDRFELVDAPDRIEVMVCARCGAVHEGNRWVDVGAEDYTDVAVEQVSEALDVHVQAEEVAWQVEPEQVDQNTIRMHCYFSGVVRGVPVEETVVVPVKISRQTCTRCGRISGSYYASTVQVRAVDRTPTTEEAERGKEVAHEIVADMEATGDRNAFVTEIDDTADGPDVKLSTTKIGKKVAQKLVGEFGGSFDSSETLITEDSDGQEVYRVTYAVRLPPFVPGDVVQPADGGAPVLVSSAHGNLKGRRVTTGEHYESSFEEGDAPDAEKLGTVEDAREATVVTVEDEYAVQVLDPETYQATTIARPDYMDPDAATVPVLKSGGDLYVLPDDA